MKNFTSSFFLALLLLTSTAYSLPKLNSLSNATATVYLDFDGHTVNSAYWNNGNPIACAPAVLTDAQITEIFNRVAEDYRPFNLNITTDSLKFLAAPLTQRIRVIVTPTSSWKAGVGGIAYIGSFTWGDDTPAFVFSDRLGPNNAKYVAECISHESGHTVGLSHQSSYDNGCNLTETYNSGIGVGETSWAPVMGNSYGKNMTGWNDGPTPYGCASTQDNLSIISSTNGFGFRADDFGETLDASTFNPGSIAFNVNGIITTSNDKDAFRFSFTELSTLHMNIVPYSVANGNAGANLDIKVTLFNHAGVQLASYDPAGNMSVTIDSTFQAGTYYLVVDGNGNLNTGNYGSLGAYSITGFRSVLPIKNINLQGRINNNQHELNWNIIADEPVASLTIETAHDGHSFTELQQTDNNSRRAMLSATDNQARYYRIKATSNSGQITYSNIISLKSSTENIKTFTLNSFVTALLNIQSTANYQYRISDVKGRTLLTGVGQKGLRQIDMSRLANGMYVVQLFCNNQLQTERIIKQ